MPIDEKAFLEKMQKSLGVEIDLSAIEEKHARKRKEEALLESLNNALTKLTIPELKQVEEVFVEPIDVTPIAEITEIIEEQLIEQPEMIVEIGRQPEPELPKDDIVTKSVLALSKTNQQDGSIQAVADKLPPGIQKELDIIKKSLADFHRFAQRHSQMGGGGEVNLRYLDDIDRGSIATGNFLKYNASSKKFEFANVTSNGVDWLHVPSSIIPEANDFYSLGNSSMRWESLWVGGNSVTFSDQNASYPDQTLTVANGVFYITDSLDTKQQSNAGFRVGNFLLQNNYISLTNATADIFIGTTLATGNVIFNRPIAVKSYDTGNTTFVVTREGRVSILAPSIPANDVGAMSIIGSANGAYQSVVNPGGMLHITGNDGMVSRITNDGFGTNAFPAYVSRAGRGTANTPTATQSGDILSRYSTVGWGTTNFAGAASPAATNIEVIAKENFTDTAGGTEYRIYTAPVGTTAKTLSLTINSNGIYSNNITSYSNISGNSATFSSNVHIGNVGVATNLIISGGANDQILVSNGTTLNWTQRHLDGVWTPVMVPAAGSNVTFSASTSHYVKVGPVVTCQFDITVNSMGTASGVLKLAGLPYLSINGVAGSYQGTVSMGYFTNLNITDAIHFSGAVINNSNTADIWLSTLNGQHIAQNLFNTTDLKVGSRLVGTVTYATDF